MRGYAFMPAQQAEVEFVRLERRIHQLETALRKYEHCRHGCVECFCVKEARAELWRAVPAQPGGEER